MNEAEPELQRMLEQSERGRKGGGKGGKGGGGKGGGGKGGGGGGRPMNGQRGGRQMSKKSRR